MEFLSAVILGIVQGITEWLPISSTGHLILTERLLHLDPAVFNLTFDAAIQLGTTLAVIIFFRQDLWRLVTRFREPKERRLLVALVMATIPAVVFGVLLQDYIETSFRTLPVIAAMLAIGGVVFLLVEKYATVRKQQSEATWKDALVIGLAQSLALVPGVSRSGSTIVAGMLLGLSREEAARFTFLLSIPIIVLAGGKKLLDVVQGDAGAVQLNLVLVGTVVAAVVGYLTIKYLLRYLAHHSLAVFAYYRFVLAAILLLVIGLGL
jgi:undecaprenyl-diphosphatase